MKANLFLFACAPDLALNSRLGGTPAPDRPKEQQSQSQDHDCGSNADDYHHKFIP
jgi:hypothetical protein